MVIVTIVNEIIVAVIDHEPFTTHQFITPWDQVGRPGSALCPRRPTGADAVNQGDRDGEDAK